MESKLKRCKRCDKEYSDIFIHVAEERPDLENLLQHFFQNNKKYELKENELLLRLKSIGILL